ncbi:hypothetical protein, partial [Janthinobacterium sp.]|uniref:hypothetical protein n=1 Tax=Janthinobacterium sp. TaxID=1871054 RepID=UPI00293D7A07
AGAAAGAGSAGLTGGAATTGAGGTGALLQAARESATAPSETSKLLRVNDMGNDMWLLMLEAVFAFFLLVFIVWWTMYSGRKPNRPAQKKPLPEPAPGDKVE